MGRSPVETWLRAAVVNELGLPRVVVWAARHIVGAAFADHVLGDLAEGHRARRQAGGSRFGTTVWLWVEVLSFLHPTALLQLRSRALIAGTGTGRRGPMLFHDLRYAWRSLRSSPGFTAMAVLTITLGIAGTTAVFSAMDGFVLRPFPFPEPKTLVTVGSAHPKTGAELTFFEHLSPAEYLDIKAARSVERVVAWDLGNRQVTVGETTENLFTGFWWGDAFATLGIQPYLGRGFSRDELDRGDRVAVLSHRVWADRFGRDTSLVGGKILVNGEPYDVVGIMPPRSLVYGADLWMPFPARPEVFARDRRMLQVMARLAPGVSLGTFTAELEVIARRTEAEHAAAIPDYVGWRMVADRWDEANVATLKPAAVAMIGAMVFVMLLVCTNVATLLLGRGSARWREIAVRGALGASRGRLFRQLLTESLLLSLIGAIGGLALGVLGIRGINRLMSVLPVSPFTSLELNGVVAGVAVAVALAAGLAFGVAPALHLLGSDLRGAVHTGAAVGGTRNRLRLQRGLIGLEAALALSLLAGSGYLLRSLAAMQRVDPGFDAANVLTFRMTLARERYQQAAREPFFQDLRDRLRALPGVQAVATTSQFPPNLFGRSEFTIEGFETKSDAVQPFGYTTIASPEYFATLGVPLQRGRLLANDDRPDNPWAVVINDVVAARYFPSDDPIGRRIRVGGNDDPWATIVGVVGATRNRGLDQEPAPELFISSKQIGGFNNQMFVLVRTAIDPLSMMPAIRAAVRAIDADQPVYAVRTIGEAYQQTQLARRLSMVVFSLFGVVALLIAAVGLYGVVSYATAQRRREIGVRVALGAERARVTTLFVRQAMTPVLVGTGLGLIAAWALGLALSSLLFQVRPGDLPTLLGAAALLVAVGVAASFIPAFGASRVDPVSTLRQD